MKSGPWLHCQPHRSLLSKWLIKKNARDTELKERFIVKPKADYNYWYWQILNGNNSVRFKFLEAGYFKSEILPPRYHCFLTKTVWQKKFPRFGGISRFVVRMACDTYVYNRQPRPAGNNTNLCVTYLSQTYKPLQWNIRILSEVKRCFLQ